MLRLDDFTVPTADGILVSSESRSVPTGGILGIGGGSAAGRTTVLHAVAGFGPRRGRVRVDDREAVATGVVSREHVLVGSLTAVENVAVSLFAEARPQRGEWERIERLLGELQLPEGSWHNLVENLSGGQQQRVSLARVLIVDRGFVCLDDPVSELDSDSTLASRRQIRQAATRGSTVVMTINGPEDEAMCDQILTIDASVLSQPPAAGFR